MRVPVQWPKNIQVPRYAEASSKPKAVEWVPIPGRTFPVKDLLRDLGARWDSETRQWLIKPAKLAKAVQIVAGDYALAGYDSEEEKTPSPTKCKKCGIQARPRQGAAPAIVIYGSGECKGCYLDRKESEQTDSRGNGRGFSGGGLYR